MKQFLKRMNWEGAFFVFIFCGLGAMSRSQDPSLLTSLMVWIVIGIPMSLLFLFGGMKSKNEI